jgi:hypothetical protein
VIPSEPEQAHGFVPVTYESGSWKTAAGDEVAWYEVVTDLISESDVEGAVERVLSVYGVSDVVVDAFDQFRKELKHPPAESEMDFPAEGRGGNSPSPASGGGQGGR